MEGAKCSPILATLPFGSGPCGGLSPYLLHHMRHHLLLPLLHQLAALVASPGIAPATAALVLPQPPPSQAAAGTPTHCRHTGLPSVLLAGQHKPDIRFMLLALSITAALSSSPKLLAAVGEWLAGVKLANLVLILEHLHCVFVTAA